MNSIKLFLAILITVAAPHFASANEDFWNLVMQARDELGKSEKWAEIEKFLMDHPKTEIDWKPEGFEPSAREVIVFFFRDFFDRIFWKLVKSQDWSKVEEWLEAYPSVNLFWKPEGSQPHSQELLSLNHPVLLAHFLSQIPSGDGIDAFEMGQELGEGFCGPVKMATHRQTGMVVAVKRLIRKQYLEVASLYPPREVELMRQLRHRNILRLIHTIKTQEAIYLVTELATGGDLFTYASQKERFDDHECKKIMRQILRGLKYLHGLGIVHRDLKLENILLDEHKDIKLADLGFAKRISCTTAVLQTMCGTPDYTAPEILLHQPYIGPELDVWSAGVILYVLRTGYMPFNDQRAVINLRYGWPPEIPITASFKTLIELTFQPRVHRIGLDDMIEHDWNTIPWTPSNHHLFSFPERARVRTVLLVHRRRESALNRIPREVLLGHILRLAL